MRAIRTTTPFLMAAVLGLASASVLAQQPGSGMNGDPDPAWQQHSDGTTSGWQGDRMRPAPDVAGDETEGREHRWHGPMRADDGYTNTWHDDAMRVHHQGDVAFVTGGVGLDESRALLRASSRYPLMLSFIGSRHEYLADVHVRIVNANGDEVLTTASRGPFLLARLPSGRYTVHVAYHGREQVRRLMVNANGHVRSTFVWSTYND